MREISNEIELSYFLMQNKLEDDFVYEVSFNENSMKGLWFQRLRPIAWGLGENGTF